MSVLLKGSRDMTDKIRYTQVLLTTWGPYYKHHPSPKFSRDNDLYAN